MLLDLFAFLGADQPFRAWRILRIPSKGSHPIWTYCTSHSARDPALRRRRDRGSPTRRILSTVRWRRAECLRPARPVAQHRTRRSGSIEEMAIIQVDQKACIRCGACVEVCSIAGVFELTSEGSAAVHPDACWHCGHCVAVCPADAIDHDGFPLEECPMIDERRLPSVEDLTIAFRARRSFRAFDEKLVPREIVRTLVTLGRWAPTASNHQSLDWIAFDDRDRIAQLGDGVISAARRFARLGEHPLIRPFLTLAIGRRAAQRLHRAKGTLDRLLRQREAGGDPIFYGAPVVLIGHSPAGNSFGRDDAIFATYNIMLAAERHGLGTCQIGFFQLAYEKSARLRRKITLPEGRAPQVAIALGYPRHAFRRALPRRSPNLGWNPR